MLEDGFVCIVKCVIYTLARLVRGPGFNARIKPLVFHDRRFSFFFSLSKIVKMSLTTFQDNVNTKIVL